MSFLMSSELTALAWTLCEGSAGSLSHRPVHLQRRPRSPLSGRSCLYASRERLTPWSARGQERLPAPVWLIVLWTHRDKRGRVRPERRLQRSEEHTSELQSLRHLV